MNIEASGKSNNNRFSCHDESPFTTRLRQQPIRAEFDVTFQSVLHKRSPSLKEQLEKCFL